MKPALRAFRAAALLAALPAVAQKPALEWVAPKEERARANPLEASDESLRKGRMLYQRHCAMCHGDHGKGDGSAARMHAERARPPRDLTDPRTQADLTDGEIFWKVGVGLKEGSKIVMPAFAEEIPKEDDRWRVVLFVRTFGRPN